MFRNYFKIAFRQLRKQKMYSAIKVGGFALSIAACLLIALYIRNELSYDRSYPHADRIYRVVGYFKTQGNLEKWTSFPAPMAGVVKKDFPEVEQCGRLMYNSLFPGAGSNELRAAEIRENTHEEGFTYADPEMLEILQLPMVYGDRAHALSDPNTMVISKRKADKYYPHQNPVGKIMYLNNDETKPYKIGGVMQDFPATSHLSYDFLLTLKGVEFWKGEQNSWDADNYSDYILLHPGTDIAAFEKKLTAGLLKNYVLPTLVSEGDKSAGDVEKNASYHLQPVTDINLKSYDIQDGLSHGDIRFIWLFGAVALFILLLACVNFINLSTAKSANRAKEVGLRKVVGSYRSGLIGQFLTESLLFSVLSFLLGLVLAWILLPWFNTLASKSLTIPWKEWWLLPVMLLSAFFIGILAGVYPAVYLSSFKPAQVLKDNRGYRRLRTRKERGTTLRRSSVSGGSKRSVLRNGLVVFQFTTSIILVISTLVIYNQMEYILHKKVGFDKDQVILVQGTHLLGDKNVRAFKTELSKLASVKSVSISDYLPIAGTKRNGNTFYNEGKIKEESGVNTQFWQVDDTYLNTMGMKLVAGRNFSYAIASDYQSPVQAVIINQTLAGQLHLKDPLGKRISNSNGNLFQVIGVVQDFNSESLRDPVKGVILHFGISPSIVSVKVNTADMKNVLSEITAVWKSFSPGEPIRYSFLDEQFANMYADVQRMGHLFTSCSILAIFIACLGLFALSAFIAEQRSKEIGIRKVLGATVSNITTLLSLDFIKLVLIAIVIASPIAGWAMHNWLQNFAYHIPIQWWIFVLAGGVAILIALFTVSFQSIRAAMGNPVESLKSA
ncbi:MAG TPA: ABC transporter permease [Puia sp.]|nr:ABC transporter permease [Puia sp.]